MEYLLVFNGVVQGVAHQGAQIHHIHEVQQPSIGHAGEGDLIARAVKALAGEHRVQHRIARLVLGLVLPDVRLHGVQEGPAPGGIRLRPQHGDLVLEVVVFPVDQLDALPGLLVLDVLVLKHILHGLQLPADPELAALEQVGEQDGHASQIHQGADIEHRRPVGPAEGGVGGDKAQVADGKDRHADDKGGAQFPPSDAQTLLRGQMPPHQPSHQQEDSAVYPRQHQEAGGALRAVRPQEAVELPLQ